MIGRDEERALRQTNTSQLIAMLGSREARTEWLANLRYGMEPGKTDADADDADLASMVAGEIDDRVPRSVRW